MRTEFRRKNSFVNETLMSVALLGLPGPNMLYRGRLSLSPLLIVAIAACALMKRTG